MPVLLLLLLLVVGLAVAGIAGLGSAQVVRRRASSGATTAAGLGVVVLGVLGFVVVGVVTAVVLGAGRGASSNDGPVPDRDGEAPVASSSDRPPSLGPQVRLLNAHGSSERRTFPASTAVVDGLAPSTVLQVHVEGFPEHASGVAEQCLAGTPVRCHNRIAVQFDRDGRASFQYLVGDSYIAGAGGCRADAPPCALVVRATGPHRASVQTVFEDTLPPPGAMRVTPRRGLVDGQQVQVDLRDLPPGAQVGVTTCAAPATSGPARCGAPASAITVEVGPDGSATAVLTVDREPVGSQRVRCGGDQACGIVVTSDVAAARAPVVPIAFAAPPGADYDPRRAVVGLTVAALLAAFAGWSIRRTDWSAVGEAAAPEIDDAEYADLDAMVAAMPPEEADQRGVRRP